MPPELPNSCRNDVAARALMFPNNERMLVNSVNVMKKT